MSESCPFVWLGNQEKVTMFWFFRFPSFELCRVALKNSKNLFFDIPSYKAFN
jgi:hypothetical protein